LRSRWGNIIDPDGDQIAPAQLAVDGEIEQRQLSHLALDLEPGSYGPDMLLPQGRSGSDQFALIPGNPLRGGRSRDFVLAHDRNPPLPTMDDNARSAHMSAIAVALEVRADIARSGRKRRS
jgi:hypothetical protein